MSTINRRRQYGFTLTELAIVLAVVGVLAAGLWNLLAGANTQVRDSSAANQQEQLIAGVKGFLASSQGQAFMENNAGCAGGCGPAPGTQAFTLPLPTSCSVAGIGTFNAPYSADTNLAGVAGVSPGFCNSLPPGFNNATTNSYGQNFLIQILRDNTPNPAPFSTPPASYSFLVLTSGGDTINDTSGARISSLMGNDGGFLYTANVCGPPVNDVACGSYGGWSQNITGFGFAAAAGFSGRIVSRTYMSPEMIQNNQWLARVNLNAGDYTPNSMTVPEYLAGNPLVMGAYIGAYQYPVTPSTESTNTIFMGGYSNTPATEPTTGGGYFNLQGGSINFGYLANPGGAAPATGTMNVQGGTINMNSSVTSTLGGTIYLDGGAITNNSGGTPDKSSISLVSSGGTNPPALSVITAGIGAANPGATFGSGCNKTSPTDPTCNWALQVTLGDETVAGLLNANSLYAGTFIYQSSDIRLKKNIEPLRNSLDDIMRLNPVSFTFKKNGKNGLGFIAQDIEKIYPQLVSEGNGGMKSVNYEGLIGPIVAAVQQLQHQNQELRQEIEAQKQHEDELLQQLKAKTAN